MAKPPDSKVTRREVDGWMAYLDHELRAVLRAPAGELRARLAVLQRRVTQWRERLGVRR